MQYTTDCGAKIYIFDTFCKGQTPQEKEAIDTALVKTYNDILLRVDLEKQASVVQEGVVNAISKGDKDQPCQAG